MFRVAAIEDVLVSHPRQTLILHTGRNRAKPTAGGWGALDDAVDRLVSVWLENIYRTAWWATHRTRLLPKRRGKHCSTQQRRLTNPASSFALWPV